MKTHPLYKNLPLESYISSPIIIGDKVWGTINFSSMKIRDKFTDEDISYNEKLADKLSQVLSKL